MELRTWAKVGIAAFIGKLVATLFVAVCVVIGFGPDKLARYLVEGTQFSPQNLRFLLLLFAAVTATILLGPIIRKSAARQVGLAVIVIAIGALAWYFYHGEAPHLPPPAPITGPSPPSTIAGPGQYTDKTAGELVTFFVGRTTLQANKLIEGEVGKWLKVTGIFKNAFTNNSQGDLTVLIRDGSAMIQCNFSSQWTDRIKDLHDGDPIAVEGQIISNQLGNPFWLVKCAFD